MPALLGEAGLNTFFLHTPLVEKDVSLCWLTAQTETGDRHRATESSRPDERLPQRPNILRSVHLNAQTCVI